MDVSEGPYDLSMLCKSKRTSLAAVGRRMQPPVPRSTLARWAGGSRTLPPERAAEMAAILEIDVSTIWRCIETAKALRMRDHTPFSQTYPSIP
jgi:hypothetical protein